MQASWIPRLALAMVPLWLSGAGAATPLAARATSAPAARPSVPGAAVACSSEQRALHVMVGFAGAGHWSSVIVVRNAGPGPCLVRGYPDVRVGLPGGAHTAEVAETPRGFTGGLPVSASPPTVVLQEGQTASAIMEGTDVPTGADTTCPSYRSFTITLPGQRRAMTFDTTIESCPGLVVHPFVVGFNGSFPTGAVVGQAPVCTLRTNSRSPIGPVVQIDAWSGSDHAASEMLFPSANAVSRYQLVLKPGAYRIHSAHDSSSLRVVVHAGQTVRVGTYGKCAHAGPVPTTTPGRATPTTTTTER